MRALITGAAGQDGTILAAHLTRRGVTVTGLIKPGTDPGRFLAYAPDAVVTDIDLADSEALRALIRDIQPTHIWNLGGFTAPGESWEHEQEIQRINVDAVAAMLDSAATLPRPARFFQASSSLIFEGTDRSPQDETFELSPSSPYARSKADALNLVRLYREEKGLFAVSGIMYNHESPLRGENFVTRKVTMAVARIARGLLDRVELGDVEVARDWGWAPDYVRASLLMLQAEVPRDYVLATGISHRLSFFVQKAFAAVGIQDWQSYVVTHASDRRVDTNKMVGDSRAAYHELGWLHTVDIDSIAERMVEHDLRLIENPGALWSDRWMD